MYLPTLGFLMAAGDRDLAARRERRQGLLCGGAVFSVLSFAARTIDMPLCASLPVGTHYFWHIFNAAVLYLLVRTLDLHAPASEETLGAWARNSGRS